jgi:hypothetical protein
MSCFFDTWSPTIQPLLSLDFSKINSALIAAAMNPELVGVVRAGH